MTTAIAAESLNEDIRHLIDAEDTTTRTRVGKLMSFKPQEDPDKLQEELERVFSAGGDILAGEAPGIEKDTVDKSGLPPMAWMLASSQMSHSKAHFGIEDILQTIWAVCTYVLKDQAIYIVNGGSEMKLPSRHSGVFEEQMERVRDMLDKLIPFIDTKEASDKEIREMILEMRGKKYFNQDDGTNLRNNMPVVNRLNRHLQICKKAIERDGVFTDRAKEGLFSSEAMRSAVFYVLQPYMVFKFVATFVPGAWNKGTWARELRPSFLDSRYAELALYRMMMDTVSHVRMSLIENPTALLEPRLQTMIEESVTDVGTQGSVMVQLEPNSNDVRTVYRQGKRTHVFDTTGSYTVNVVLPGLVEMLIVAGGGGGGNASGGNPGGGGGAGEVMYREVTLETEDDLSVQVGGGGSAGQNGSDSQVSTGNFTATAAGGGAGGAGGGSNGADGGSGGGGGSASGEAGSSTISDDSEGGVSRNGNAGGSPSGDLGGGGGGATGEGQTGDGGAGRQYAFTGNEIMYGTGGDGGGSDSGDNGRSGEDNTGSGGGGGSAASGQEGSGGRGGSGIVIVRYDDGTGGGVILASLENLGSMIISTINARYIAQDRQRIPRFYHSISLASSGTKHVSAHLMDMDQQLQQRKNNLRSMLENHQFLIRLTRGDRIKYIIGTVAVCILVIVYFGLIMLMGSKIIPSDTYVDYLAFAVYALALIVIVGVIIAWALRTMTEKRIAKRMY